MQKTIHCPLTDLAKATGTEARIKAQFRAPREDIREQVTKLLHDLDIPVAQHLMLKNFPSE